MVVLNVVTSATVRGLLLAEAASGGDKLPPPTRAAVLMALLAIALIGLMFVVAILLGGHWVRRQGNFRRGPSVPPDRRPLRESSVSGGPLTTPGDSTSDTIPSGGSADPSETVPL